MPPPEVSIVIPTRDRWSVLASSALRAAMLQQGVELEVIVVDDGSRDETPERLAAIEDPTVRTLRREISGGVASARNLGIDAARGRWIAFLDDDDVWSPTKLRSQLDAAASSDIAFVVCGVVVVGRGWRVEHVTRPEQWTASDLLERNAIPAGSSNVLARADLVREAGGFDERLTYVADWDLWIRLAMRGRIAVCSEPLVGYVRQGSGMRFSGKEAVDEMRYFVDKHHAAGLSTDPARFLGWVALQDRRAGRRRSAADTLARSGIAYRRPRQLVSSAAALADPRRARSSRAGAQPPLEGTSQAAHVEWLQHYR